MKRGAVFAGRWYPSEERALARDIEAYLDSGSKSGHSVRGLVSPHAGYIHSGAVAGAAFAAVTVPDQVVVLCPNHRDRRPQRPAFAVASHDVWATPLGDVEIDGELSQAIVASCPGAALDSVAHEEEHAIELQLPFLRFLNPQVRVVAISVGTLNFESLTRLGAVLAETMREDSLLVASSDMNHYEARDIVFAKDQKAIDKIKEFDGAGLLKLCAEEKISMCGRGPVVSLLERCDRLGAKNVKLLSHDCSKGRGGSEAPVVGYAALAVF